MKPRMIKDLGRKSKTLKVGLRGKGGGLAEVGRLQKIFSCVTSLVS